MRTMNAFGKQLQTLIVFWFLVAWLIAINALIWELENLDSILRWGLVLGAVLLLTRILTAIDRHYLLSPFFLIGFITLIFYSIVPSLYGQVFPEPTSYFETKAPRTSHDHAIAYIGSQGEILVLQFSAFCFLVFSIYIKWKTSENAVKQREVKAFAGPNYLSAIFHFIVYVTAFLYLVSTWTTFGQDLFSSGLGTELRHALAPLMSFSTAALAYYSAKDTTNLKYFAPITLVAAVGAMIVSGLAATAVFSFLVAIFLYLIVIKPSLRASLYIIGGAALVIPLSILVTIIPRGEAENTPTASALIEYSAAKLTSKLVHRQTTSGHCLNGIYKKHRSVEGANPFFFASAIVPRALWPGKPILSRGSEYAEKYCGQTGATKLQHSESITLLGEPLLNGGFLGIVVAQFCIAVFFFIATNSLGSGQPAQIIFVVALLPWLATFEQHFAEYFGNLVKVMIIMLPLFAALIYFHWRHRQALT
jgi:hypothetical protein